MILYIHFGIYKAGSSYLQYICANQRGYLKSKGIYFPKSKEDHKMKAGLISKGNADGLEIAIRSEEDTKITTILKAWYDGAKNDHAKAVFISAEALIHQLAIPKRLHQILTCAQSVGFTEIKVMGFFRNLADHALSTYKHRAKSGRTPDYKHWVNEVYETPKLFENLSQVIAANQNIEWTLRKFQKNSDFLKQAFFKDWLNIEVPDFQTRPNVNESVTLSEVKVMNQLSKLYPNVTDYFVNDLKAIPSQAKAKDSALQGYILSTFASLLTQQQNCLDQLNVFLPEEECLRLLENKSIDIENEEPSVALSEQQLEVLSQRMQFFNTPKGKKILLRRRLVELLPKFLSTYLTKN
jgi:hypothetical protein